MRHPFAGTGAEVLVDATGVNGGATVRFYDAESGGSQVTDLRTPTGDVIPDGVITALAYGQIPSFLGPDDGRTKLWADAGLGRLKLLATDTADRTTQLEATALRKVGDDVVGPDGVPIDIGGTVGPNSITLDELDPDVEAAVLAVAGKADTADLAGYVPTTQAATVIDGVDPATGDGVWTVSTATGSISIAFADSIGGAITYGDAVAPPPPTVEYEPDIDFRWASATMPTGAPATSFWPATKPVSGGPTLQFVSIAGASSYRAGAFPGGRAGYEIKNDWVTGALGSMRSVEPAGSGGGFVGVSICDAMWDSSPVVPEGATTWLLELFGRTDDNLNDIRRVQVALRYLSGQFQWGVRAWNGTSDTWLATQPVQQAVSTGSDNDTGVRDPFVLGLKLQGPTSALTISSATGTQTVPVDLTGIGNYNQIYLGDQTPGPVERGKRTVRQLETAGDNMTPGKILSAVGDLAADAGFTVGA